MNGSLYPFISFIYREYLKMIIVLFGVMMFEGISV